jgi:hypothetical protein
MKKALAGPAKSTEKKPERRAIIAAARRRIRAGARRPARRVRGALSVHSAKKAPRRVAKGLRSAPARALALSRRVDRAVNRLLLWARPPIARLGRAAGRLGGRAGRLGGRAARRLRPLGVLLFRALSMLERRLLAARDLAVRAATRASAALTPQRAIGATILAAAACLTVSQFIDYRAVEIGQGDYAGLPAPNAPRLGAETAGRAHAYLLIPLALLAGGLALVALRKARRRGLGRIVFALGLLSLAVILLVDLPAGLDAGAQSSRFSGASAVLLDGFYAELASAAGLMLGGLLLIWQPRARKPRLARTQGVRRRARTLLVRKQGGRPRTQPDEGLQRPGATMRGRA